MRRRSKHYASGDLSPEKGAEYQWPCGSMWRSISGCISLSVVSLARQHARFTPIAGDTPKFDYPAHFVNAIPHSLPNSVPQGLFAVGQPSLAQIAVAIGLPGWSILIVGGDDGGFVALVAFV